MADLAPIFVSDVRDDAYWYSISRDQGVALRAWLRSNNLEPNDIYRFEVYLMDTLFAKVFTYARDENGRFHIEGGKVIQCEPFLAPLNSMPPGSASRPEIRSAESRAQPQTDLALSHDTRQPPKALHGPHSPAHA